MRAEVAAGLRLVGRDRLLAVLTAYPALANLTTAGVISLQVLFLVRVVGVGTAVTGLLLAVGPAGGVAGAVAARPAARRLGTARVLLIASLGFPLLGLLIGLTTRGAGMAWYVAGAAAETAGGVAGSIILTSFRQAYVPPAMLGRVVASQRFIAFGAIPLGALAAGGLGTAIGVRGAIWVMLAAYPLSGVLLLTRPILGHRDLPARPDEPAGPAATARSE